MYVHSTDYELTTEFVQNPVFFCPPSIVKLELTYSPPCSKDNLFLWNWGWNENIEWNYKMLVPLHLWLFSPFFSKLPLKTNFNSSFMRLIHFTQHSKMCASQQMPNWPKTFASILHNEMISFLYLYEENSICDYKPIFNPINWFAIFSSILFYS